MVAIPGMGKAEQFRASIGAEGLVKVRYTKRTAIAQSLHQGRDLPSEEQKKLRPAERTYVIGLKSGQEGMIGDMTAHFCTTR